MSYLCSVLNETLWYFIKNKVKVMNEKVGTIAGQIWNALNENGALNTKDLKKAAKVKNDKDLFMGLGWLLREDKVSMTEAEKDFVVALN